MALVSKGSPKWRRFGGGGLLVGGLLWLMAAVLAGVGVTAASPWLGGIALILIAVAVIFVAFGQTGSNGAVGTSLPGKIALLVYAAGWLLFGIGAFVALGSSITFVAGILLMVGGLLSAWFIYQAGVARGAARWILFVTAIVGIVFIAVALGWFALGGWWLGAVFAALVAATGWLYLLNRKSVGLERLG